MPRNASPFAAVRSEGALLPPELLARIAELDRDLGGLAPSDYHLVGGGGIGPAIAQSWNRLLGVWKLFEASLAAVPPEDHATGLTRDKWLAPLFHELGFGRLPVTPARVIDGVSYPISHGWSDTPIHLIGVNLDLDRRTPGASGAARMSPHTLVQTYLNRVPTLWGIVSNGRELRLLRDNLSLTRQAYLSFDLEAMFSGEIYADFAILWLCCHQSRFEAPADRPAECFLERWSQAAENQGTRALDALRQGVETAIKTLGAGFLAHRANAALRGALSSGELTTQDYYRELLRLVYRLIFLFVAEDRDLIHPDDASAEARSRYREHYSMARLRTMAERLRGGPHSDLWQAVSIVCEGLASPEGLPALGLPFLGSSLFAADSCPHLDDAELTNRDLLTAVRALSSTLQGKVRRPIDYRNMGSEELGSIYESLLELHPEVLHETATFELETAAGNERKTTGSYYTPSSLIAALLDTALDPVLDEAAGKPEPEKAILALKVLDPACGSGHFLTAAAHRIARRLAQVRSGDDEPSPGATRTALRDVIAHCVYGIDVNPMAVELCKVSLWMEAMEPGRPLSFLDHHIVCGNSLLGTTPALIAKGIPDGAYEALAGDDKAVVKSLKKRNREERDRGQTTLFGEAVAPDLVAEAAARIAELEAAPGESAEDLAAKRTLYEQATTAAEAAKLVADAWCAAFFVEKTPGAPEITTELLRNLEQHPDGGSTETKERIREIARTNRFLHLHLAFPQVFHIPGEGEEPDDPEQGWSGGFDVVVGNPPWERIKLQEKEWFASRDPVIASAANKASRARLIAALAAAEPDSDAWRLARAWRLALRESEASSAFYRESGVFPLGGVGDVNLYAVFVDLFRRSIRGTGAAGVICPIGIAVGATYQQFFQHLVGGERLASFFSFENEEKVFPAVHNETKFALLTVRGRARRQERMRFSGFLRQATQILDPERIYTLTAQDIELLNPNTRTAPLFRYARDAEVARRIFESVPVLRRLGPPVVDPWGVDYMRMFDMANDSHRFITAKVAQEDSAVRDSAGWVYPDGRRLLPLYEGKMIWHFDHRYGTYEGQTQAQENKQVLPHTSDADHADADFGLLHRYWVPEADVDRELKGRSSRDWFILFRDVGPSERTMVPCIAPRSGAGNASPLLLTTAEPRQVAFLLGALASLPCDYALRQTSSARMTLFAIEQAPVPAPPDGDEAAPWVGERLLDFVVPRVVELTSTSWDLACFAEDCGFGANAYRWDHERRRVMRAELDALMFHVYGLDRADTEWVLDTFTVLRKYEERPPEKGGHGGFLTRSMVLERYDAMSRAIESGAPYATPLDPPPADPAATHRRDTT